MKKKFLGCVAAAAMAVGLLASTVFAGTSTDEATGLCVTIETDKDSYNNGEALNMTVVITNNSTYAYKNLNYEIAVPEGVTLAAEASISGTLTLAGNASRAIDFGSGAEITTDAAEDSTTPVADESNGGSKTPGIAIAAVGAVLAVIACVIFAVSKKNKKSATASVLVLVLGLSSLAAIPAEAAIPSLDNYSFTATKTIVVGGKDAEITVTIATKTEGTLRSSVDVSNIGIHDPSVFQNPVSGEFYSYGSHIIAGNSDDMISWTYIAKSSAGYGTTNELFSKNYKQEFAEVYEWLGKDVIEGIWALDVTYSQAAADAGNDPYLMYVTVVNGSFKAALCLATSDRPEGPFTYKGMIVCSDYRQSEVEAGHTNLLEVLGVDSVSEMTATQKNFYFKADSNAYKAALPDCIDAAPFYDKEGNLYMTYGSFTCKGGLRVLKLDETTGLRSDETYEYKADGSQDPYFGKKIANANGEGPYILRVDSDKSSTGSYYFLFWSQGNLRATGGYNMRMFRSEYPDYGYVDYAGQSALDSISATNLGVRIMDGFQFTNMTFPSTANGGNSAIVTDEGKIFVHYHSKSSEAAAYGENGFVIKSNQMFLNADGWLVTAPYKYYGETMSAVDKTEVVGDYEFIYHRLAYYKDPVNTKDNYVSPVLVTLNEDGSVSGTYTGTWTLSGNDLTITIGEQTYKGVVLKQYDESTERKETVVFTASGADNRTVWGSKIMATDAERTSSDLERLVVAATAEEDFTLTTTGLMNSAITWSSDSGAIAIDGAAAQVTRQDADQTVTLTAKAAYGAEVNEKTFSVIVPAEEFTIPSTISSSAIDLPETTAAGKTITWTSSDVSVINPQTGAVVVPAKSSKQVTLTGTIAGSDRVIEAVVTVMPLPTDVVYAEDYDGLTTLDASAEGNLWYSTNAAGSVTLQADSDGGKYVQFAPGAANSRGALCNFPADGQMDGIYVLDFDLALTAGDNQTTEFAVATENMAYLGVINDGIASGYLFKLSANAGSTTWAVNDGETFEAAVGQWIHVNALADTESGTVAITITDGDTELYSGTVEMNGAGTLRGFYIRGGRYNSVICVDNVTIKK